MHTITTIGGTMTTPRMTAALLTEVGAELNEKARDGVRMAEAKMERDGELSREEMMGDTPLGRVFASIGLEADSEAELVEIARYAYEKATDTVRAISNGQDAIMAIATALIAETTIGWNARERVEERA